MVVSVASSLLLLQAAKAAPETLAGELRSHPVPNAVVVAPEAVRRETARRAGKEIGFAAFGRKVVRIGSLNAVVPTTVVAFDDALAQPPNLYDGLPREAKALYLLTTLTPTQRKLAATRGLALDDLQGEPRAVFDSLLPKRLAWTKRRTGGEKERDGDLGSGTVEGDARRGIRLRFLQTMNFDFAMADDPNASSSTTTTGASRATSGPNGATRRTRSARATCSMGFGSDGRPRIASRREPSTRAASTRR